MGACISEAAHVPGPGLLLWHNIPQIGHRKSKGAEVLGTKDAPQIRELFIEELSEVHGGSTASANPLKDLLCCSTMACCEEGQCCG